MVSIIFSPSERSQTPKINLKEKLLQLDPVRIVLAMAVIICIILSLRCGGNSHPWNSSQVIGLLVGFGFISIAP